MRHSGENSSAAHLRCWEINLILFLCPFLIFVIGEKLTLKKKKKGWGSLTFRKYLKINLKKQSVFSSQSLN